MNGYTEVPAKSIDSFHAAMKASSIKACSNDEIAKYLRLNVKLQ